MSKGSKGPEWTEASAGRLHSFRRVYRDCVQEAKENEADRVLQISEMSEYTVEQRPTPSLPPQHDRDDDIGDKWQNAAGLRPTWMPTFPDEELKSVRHSHILATSFIPQRHLRYVLGRPVLAPRIHLLCHPRAWCQICACSYVSFLCKTHRGLFV